jgi:hypothetical protein
MTVKTNRSLLTYILLGIITFGIYDLYFMYKWAKDINAICDGDGKNTAGLLKYIFFSLITCGIYSLYWFYALGNRIQENAKEKYDIAVAENGTTILLWIIVGSLICGLGSLYAYYLLFRNTNIIAQAYTEKNSVLTEGV